MATKFSLLVALFAAAPLASATYCKSNEFWWSKKRCCLPRGYTPTPSPPANRSCPSTHWWRDSCCAPRNTDSPSQPSCPTGTYWDDDEDTCKPRCGNNQIWWSKKSLCVPKGGSGGTPPSDTSCPNTHWWRKDSSCCAPKNSDDDDDDNKIKCDTNWNWNTSRRCCEKKSTTTTRCKSNEIWWSRRNICITKGGSGGSPPSSVSCPRTHWWRNDSGCCAPKDDDDDDDDDKVTCDTKWKWNRNNRCCEKDNTPTPSSATQKKTRKARSGGDCPAGLTACNISSLTADFDCVDTKYDQESCGGCVAAGQGLDCTSISGARAVGCESGECKVYSCLSGFRLAKDGGSCEALFF